MRTIKSSWQREAGRLICRWSEAKELPVPYSLPWIQDAFKTTSHAEGVSPLVLALDFTRLGPLGGRGWFERALGGFTSRPACGH
jgi:hypothetical protein